MFFASDNGGPVHPQVMAALNSANAGYATGYGSDPVTARATALVREVFEAPDAAVYFVATGTAANVLALSTHARPWDTIFCTALSHINVDECNGPEFYAGGAKLMVVGDDGAARMDARALEAALAGTGIRGVHNPQKGPVSITQATEMGTLYSLEGIAGIAEVAHRHGVPLHLDGARFANACGALGCSAAEMTWKAGVDLVSFGGTKNGCMGVEAVVMFDPGGAREFELRRKRGAHLFSKHRYLAAQMLGYLEGGLWLELAAMANARAARLARGLAAADGMELLFEVEANMVFARMPRARHQALMAAGAVYYVEDGDVAEGPGDAALTGRFVCDWSIPEAEIDRFIGIVSGG